MDKSKLQIAVENGKVTKNDIKDELDQLGNMISYSNSENYYYINNQVVAGLELISKVIESGDVIINGTK